MSSNENIFRVAGLLWRDSTGHRWIHFTKASDSEILMFSFICVWTNVWANIRNAAHHDITVIQNIYLWKQLDNFTDLMQGWNEQHGIFWATLVDN